MKRQIFIITTILFNSFWGQDNHVCGLNPKTTDSINSVVLNSNFFLKEIHNNFRKLKSDSINSSVFSTAMHDQNKDSALLSFSEIISSEEQIDIKTNEYIGKLAFEGSIIDSVFAYSTKK